jgi:NhaP-type Na+/H+ or K+/H+ antiporter
MNPMSGGLVVALVAGGFLIGFVLGFLVRSLISRGRRRRWKQLIAEGGMNDPASPPPKPPPS